jgi:hypothetical protein
MVGFVSGLRSALEELRGEDLRAVPDEALEEDFRELQQASRALEAERLRRLAEIERRGLHARRGHPSTGAWLADTFRLGWGQATTDVRAARALERMPLASEALARGELSAFALRALVAARETSPHAFRRSEEALVSAARSLPAKAMSNRLAAWHQRVDADRAEREATRRFERRRLHISRTFHGMVRLDGELDPDTGQTVITALRAICPAPAARDERTPPQRRADGLGEICRHFLDTGERAEVGGERPHVVVTVAAEGLVDPASSGEMEDVGTVTAETVRRWACDASISRIITRGASEPLDVGRRTPVVPASLRRALVVRDRGCAFPGCDRPPGWCDAHHVTHWADGGPTSADNLVMLCRRHHRMVHGPGAFTVRIVGGRPRFGAPDGAALPDADAAAEMAPT